MELKYIITFIVSGLTVSGISYFGNVIDPALGGILSGIPISIPAMLTITQEKNRKNFIWNAALMVALLSVITFACALLYIYYDIGAWVSVIISMCLWFIGAGIYYKYQVK